MMLIGFVGLGVAGYRSSKTPSRRIQCLKRVYSQ
jgi:hypothetical protein